MGHLHFSRTERKNKHLSHRERFQMEVMLKARRSTKEISQAIGCSQRTIQREQQRGQIQQLSTALEYFHVYDADYAQNDYLSKHEGKGTSLKIGHDHALCQYIEKEIKAKKSPDVIAKSIRQNPQKYPQPLCTKTIYTYLEKNIFFNVSYQDLTCGHYRKKHGKAVNRPSYKNLQGRGIEERPKIVEGRQEAGHWEMDLVLGKKGGSKKVLLTLTERTSRREIIRKLPDKTQVSVIHALDEMERQMGRRSFQKTFRTITVDNGSEFLGSSEMERSCIRPKKSRTIVYYAHPYSAYERGSNENMNRMIRRFIPKGTDIAAFSKKDIQRIENWLNNYPRKILGYQTPLAVYGQVA